jgi:hypothetical protein
LAVTELKMSIDLTKRRQSSMSTVQTPTLGINFRAVTTRLQHSMIALVFMTVCNSGALAQAGHTHTLPTQNQEASPDQQSKANALIKIVRDSTERFKNVAVAEAEGYALQFGCVVGDSSGAMGLHFVNGDLVNRGVLDATKPQIVIYEAEPDGHLRLIGADYLLFQSAWDANNPAPPQLMGQAFHLFDAPNQFALPAFYTLHVWAWKKNPNGSFVNWHPNVSCESFSGATL